MPCRHREAIVEAALAAARDVNERAIEYRLAVLVDVQAAQQHGLDETAGLRDTEDRGLLRRRRPFQRIVAQVGHEIADARHAERDDDRIARRVGELIDAAGLEAAVEADLGRRAAARGLHEGPRLACDQRCCAPSGRSRHVSCASPASSLAGG